METRGIKRPSYAQLGRVEKKQKTNINTKKEELMGKKPDFIDWTKRAPKVDMQGQQRVTMQDFELLKGLGHGGFAKVFLTRKTSGPDAGKLYALKQVYKSEVRKTRGNLKHVYTERRVLEHVRDSPFMVTLHYAFQTNTTLNLVMDFMNGGDFRFYMNKIDALEENKAMLYIGELVLALESLHTMGIIYRDLKPENILLDAEGHIVLADFGLCEEFDPRTQIFKTQTHKGTAEYMAPEVFLKNNYYDFSADWFSLGVLAYEIMVADMPFSSSSSEKVDSVEDIKKRVLTTEPYFPEFLSPTAKNFIGGLLTKDPTKRLGANGFQEVKNHPFFNDMDWDLLYRKGYAAPYKPEISHPEDVGNFEEEFTSMSLTPTDMAPSKGNNRWKPMKAFSYVYPSTPLTEDTTDNFETTAIPTCHTQEFDFYN